MFHKKEVSVLGVYYMMVFDWKHVSKSARQLEANLKRIAEDVKRHRIEKIQEDMNAIDSDIDRTEGYAYKLAFRDLLLLRKALLHLRVLARVVHENIRGTEKLERAILSEVRGTKLERDFSELLREDKHADDFVAEKIREVIKEVHEELQNEQKAVFGLIAELSGGKAVSLMFKGDAEGFWRMMQLRWGAIRRLRKNLGLEAKVENKIKEDFRGILDGLKRLYDRTRKSRDALGKLKGEVKKEREGTRKIIKELKELFRIMIDIIKDSYKIFLFDLILLKVAIESIFTQEQLAEAWARNYEIPRSMAIEYIRKLEEDKEKAEEDLKNLEKFLLQLWNI